ncbi:unnamed protein product, partial [Effrenium voratum]
NTRCTLHELVQEASRIKLISWHNDLVSGAKAKPCEQFATGDLPHRCMFELPALELGALRVPEWLVNARRLLSHFHAQPMRKLHASSLQQFRRCVVVSG